MWTVDPTRWSALAALVLVAALLALACGERSAERPDDVANKSEGGKSEETRSLKVMSANIYLEGRKDQPG
jgi:ABC-type glycerol-3-phosphate transport system substrate-binding protein